jgi:pimeloyl-ACP methyl ester carboxylesterase
MLAKMHYVLFVPGLGGESFLFRKAANAWNRLGFIPIIYDVGWKDGQQYFRPKLEKLLARIDALHASGGIVSLVGTSAGGSAVLNAFTQRSDKIHTVVNICGRLRAGNSVRPTLEDASKKSKSFKESVMMFETNEPTLTKDDRKKILTIRSFFDETVPITTISVRGAHNIQIVSVEHILSIALAMTAYARTIAHYLHD